MKMFNKVKVERVSEEEGDLLIVVNDIDDRAIVRDPMIADFKQNLEEPQIIKISRNSDEEEEFIIVDDDDCDDIGLISEDDIIRIIGLGNGFDNSAVIDPSVFERDSPNSPTPEQQQQQQQQVEEPVNLPQQQQQAEEEPVNLVIDEDAEGDDEDVEGDDGEPSTANDSGFSDAETIENVYDNGNDPDYIPESKFNLIKIYFKLILKFICILFKLILKFILLI